MDGVKSFFQSRTIWALIINALCQILKLKGYEVGDAEKEAAVTFILNCMDFGTLALAVYYRFKATRQVAAIPVK